MSRKPGFDIIHSVTPRHSVFSAMNSHFLYWCCLSFFPSYISQIFSTQAPAFILPGWFGVGFGSPDRGWFCSLGRDWEVFHGERLHWVGRPGRHPVVVPNHISMIEVASRHRGGGRLKGFASPGALLAIWMVQTLWAPYMMYGLIRSPCSTRFMFVQVEGLSQNRGPPKQDFVVPSAFPLNHAPKGYKNHPPNHTPMGRFHLRPSA